jgi:formamidopyrimidine-DNA glycosylase
MPEGDVLHRLAATFDQEFAGRACRVSSPQGRFAASAARIDGRTVAGAHAVGKHLFVGFAGASPAELLWLHVHLGLYGSWRFAGDEDFAAPPSIGAPRVPVEAVSPREGAWRPPEPVGQVRVRLSTDHGVADLSGPTRCELLSDAERRSVEAALGPDPLAPGASTDGAARRRFVDSVRARRRAVGELVMDQSIVAGVGNIYRAESLFLAGVSPLRRGDRVSPTRLGALWDIVCRLMAHGLEVGRIETVDPGDAPEPPLPGDPEASRWYVYHRTGRPCLRCGTPVREQAMQGRRLFWCPSCQR